MDPTQIELYFDELIKFPQIVKGDKTKVFMPLPHKHGKSCNFMGFTFSDHEKMYDSIWTLYLTSLVKIAANIHVLKNIELEEWQKNKTKRISDRVIDYIRNTLASSYLQENQS